MILISLLLLAATLPIESQTDEPVRAVPEHSQIPLRPSRILTVELRLTLNSNGNPATCKVVRAWHSEEEYHCEHPDYCVSFMRRHKGLTYRLDQGKTYATVKRQIAAAVN